LRAPTQRHYHHWRFGLPKWQSALSELDTRQWRSQPVQFSATRKAAEVFEAAYDEYAHRLATSPTWGQTDESTL